MTRHAGSQAARSPPTDSRRKWNQLDLRVLLDKQDACQPRQTGSLSSEIFQLTSRQRAPMAARQIAETSLTDANTDETFHFVTDFVKHATNLPINSLAQDDAQMRWLN